MKCGDRACRLAVCLALALLTAFVYARTAENGFIDFDDPFYVSRNPVVQQGLTAQGLLWALRSTEQANWHPLTWWSHMLDVSLFGMRPGPQHLVSALLHAIAAVLLFLALEGLTGRRWPGALVAAIFAVHPLHVESVAWIAERKDVLCALFWMLALLAYLRYVRRPGRVRYLAVAACFALSLMAKPMAVTLPLVLLLLDWWPLGRVRLREKLPLLALSLAGGVVTLAAQWGGGAVPPLTVFPLAVRLENALVSTLVYPLKLLWPARLGMFYPHPGAAIPGWQWLLAALLVAAVSWLVLARRSSSPWLATGWFWYLVTVAPVIGLIQVGSQARADRYAYLPSVGLTIALAWGCAALARRAPLWRATAAGGAVLTVVALAVLACEQAGLWRDSETLFRRTLAVAGESPIIRANLGGAYFELGRWEEAIREFETALRERPEDVDARFYTGLAASKLERWDAAAAAFQAVIGQAPNHHEARFGLGVASMKLQRWQEAGTAFHRFLEAKPQDREARFNLGIATAALRRWSEAAAAFRMVVAADPADREARFNLGLVAVAMGDRSTAETQRAALEAIDRADAGNLGKAMAGRGWRTEQAGENTPP